MDIDLNDKKIIDDFNDGLRDIIIYDDLGKAYSFFVNLEKIINAPKLRNSITEETLRQYELMIKKAKFIAMGQLKEEELLNLLENDFNLVYEIDNYDLVSKFENFLVLDKYFAPERDEVKEKVVNILLTLKTNITSKQININGEILEPNVENWLKDFRNQFTEEGFLEDLNLSKYFSGNKNFLDLTEQEKERVKTLFAFYKKLKIKSSSVEGFEESVPLIMDDGSLKIYRGGVVEKIPDEIEQLYESVKNIGAETPVAKSEIRKVFQADESQVHKSKEDLVKQSKPSNVDEILKSYKRFELDFKDIELKILKDLKLKNSSDLDEEFINLVNSGKKQEAMAVLSYVCKSGFLSMFLKDNQVLKNDFSKFLNNRFSADVSESIINSFGSVESVSLFLQFLLNDKLNLTPRDSGIFGMYLANIFKKSGQGKYFPIVYGDVNSSMFVFREIQDVAGKLMIK